MATQQQRKRDLVDKPEGTLHKLKVLQKNPDYISIARKICVGAGTVFLVLGLLGFVVPAMWGAHINLAHNLIHIVTGIVSLWIGYLATDRTVREFNAVFGAFYGLLGVLGFLVGEPMVASTPMVMDDNYLLVIWPNVLELGAADHAFHLIVGAILFAS